MDIYTTSFCLPRNLGPFPRPLSASSSSNNTAANSHTERSLSPASSFDRSSAPRSSLDDLSPISTRGSRTSTEVSIPPSSSTATSRSRVRTDSSSARRQALDQAQAKRTAAESSNRTVEDAANMEAMKKLCMEAMAGHQCHATVCRVGGQDGTGAEAVSMAAKRMPGSSLGISEGDHIPGYELKSDIPPGSTTSLSSITSSVPTPLPAQDSLRGKGWNFHVSGGQLHALAARGMLIRESSFKRSSTVKVPRSEVLDAKENVKVEMRRKLDEIASLTRAHLAIVGQVQGSLVGFGLETERNVEIVITGGYENVEQARVRLLVLLDELSGLHSEVCEIDYKLHNIIAGRKRCVIQTIQEETATNIYFPTPLSGVMGPRNLALLAKQNLIFITGEFFGVQRARDMLFQVSMHKSKCIISRDTAILPRKLDWMISDRLDEIKTFMNDNGTFINFPIIGTQGGMISVYGDHRVNIERTIRSVMQLACQFYCASFWLLPTSYDVFMPQQTINPATIPPILKYLSASTGTEVVFKNNSFELHGTETEVRQAMQIVMELDAVQSFQHEIRFQIELANEHREFISGKKNGKLNKIMKAANVKIKFETFNDYNFLIDIAGTDEGVLAGLSLLQEELPAEISFHIPEGYHKRIIGVGGKNIQRIMKKYGVYVKFSNAEDHAALGGYVDNEDNVVARTPAKNAVNLENLKQSVMEMVHPKDKDFVVETVSIPRRYHRTLLGEKSIFIHDIENKTNSVIRFPNKETASDIVVIFGPESQVHIAAQMLLVHIAFEAEYRLPHSNEIAHLTLSSEWVNLTEQIKREMNITILPFVDRTGGREETIIKFCLNRSNVDFLSTARDQVEDFLVNRKINLYPGSLRPRADSFADAFPHFNSRLLSAGGSESDLRADARSKELRPAASTPDIKALFDSPTYVYRGADQDQSPGLYLGGAPQLSPVEYNSWSAPRQMPYSPQTAYSPQNTYSPSYQHTPSRLSAEDSALSKRASDNQLEEKMKRSTPRSFIPRAQSLDMGRLDGTIPPAPASATLPRSQPYTDRLGNDDVNRVLNSSLSNLSLS